MALCHATSSCHTASWRPSCPDAHLVPVAVTTLCHATSSCRSSSSCLPRPCVHRILVPTASGAPWRHVPVPATSRLRVPPAAPAGLGAVPLLGDGSWPPTQDAASGAAAGLGAAVPHPGLGCWGVPGGAQAPSHPSPPRRGLGEQPGMDPGPLRPRDPPGGYHDPVSLPRVLPSSAALTPPLPSPQGVLGSSKSGKSALVHRFLTGSYVGLEPTESEWPRGWRRLWCWARDGQGRGDGQGHEDGQGHSIGHGHGMEKVMVLGMTVGDNVVVIGMAMGWTRLW